MIKRYKLNELPDICLKCENLKQRDFTVSGIALCTCENALDCKKLDDAILEEENEY